MLDLKIIREEPERLRQALERRGETQTIDDLLTTDRERRSLISRVEELKNRRNVVSKEIGALKKAGEDASRQQQSMREVGEQIAGLDQRLRELEEVVQERLLVLPNIPHPNVPVGQDASANKLVREVGALKQFDFEPQPHWALGERLGLFDFERGARMSGTGFPILIGPGARLQRALIQWMLDVHVQEHGYTEMATPFLCTAAATRGTGQLPKLEDEMYKLPADDLYLIPTGEVPLTNYYREEIIGEDLPLYLTAYTPCFRREAGAAGRETRGLIRVHQFDKVELVKFVEPQHSFEELEKLLGDAEDILQRLALPYRVVELCTGDMSFASAKTYDIELWAPGHNDWLEVSSCSNFEDFQARRARIRYRNRKGKVAFVHTLNGSGVALPRLVVAILENFQTADGSIMLPEVLWPYLGGLQRLEAKAGT